MDDRTCGAAMLLAAFGMQLRGARIEFEIRGGALEVINAGGSVVAVTCAPREDDVGRLWLFGGDRPLAEAKEPRWALTGLKGMLTAAPRAER